VAARAVPGWAWVTLAFVVLLAAFGARYGFHRDELYFVEAGRHPALAYADQPALVPLLASRWYDLVQGSLWAFRLVPAVVGGAVVALAALTARELGGDRRDMTWTAVVVATATTMFVVAHLFGTTVFDAALTAGTVLALLRAVRLGGPGPWLLVGAVAALALAVKTLPATILLCCAAALLLVGPRQVFRSPWPYLAGMFALLGLVPTLLWQEANGWPQLELAASIAEGGSGTSVDRALLLPLLLTVTGPLTAVVLGVGAVALWRTPGRRWLAVAAALLVVLLLLTGGKPYYVLGLVPALVAAGVPVCRRWAGERRGRRATLVGLVATNAVIGAFIGLPLLPAALAPVDVVYDHGEQVGWAELADAVASAAADSDAELVLAGNYGEAGALDRAARSGVPLPPVASGHNGYWWWSEPDPDPQRVLAVGWWRDEQLAVWFDRCDPVGTVSNDAGVDNDEAGVPLRACSGPLLPWPQLWQDVRRLG
jgi:hypothetical protein